MRFTKPLDAILNTEVKTRILRFLCKTNAEWNGSQIAKEIGITPAAAHAALSALYREGVLEFYAIWAKPTSIALRRALF